MLLWLGRIDESIAAAETARRFDPRIGSPAGVMLALAYHIAGRYSESVAVATSFIGRFPDNVFLLATRAAAPAQAGNIEEARRAAEEVRLRSPFFPVDIFGTRFVSAEHQARVQEGLRKAGL